MRRSVKEFVKTCELLRPVKPCPGVPGIHLNADRTVSMTAALLCGAGVSPVHKDRAAPRITIRSRTTRMRKDMPGRCCYG